MKPLKHLPPGSVSLKGTLGEAINLTTRNRLMRADYKLAVDAYRYHLDEKNGWNWRGEFWGKTVRSAIRAWEANPNDELKTIIDNTVIDLLSTQDADGCISSVVAKDQPDGLDIWNRKYAMLGLVRYCESMNHSPAIRTALARSLDHLMSQVQPCSGKPLYQYGTHQGLSSASILGAVIKIYRLTGEKRYLDFAKFLYEDPNGAKPVFDAIESGLPPYQILTGKAYEMMSCVEGMIELYRETGDEKLLKTAYRHYRETLEQEIFITGVGGLRDGMGEYWNQGKLKQTSLEDVGALGETCVTVTWIRFVLNLLREIREASMADQIEIALYNGMLGSMTPEGAGYSHRNPTPLAGAGWRKTGAYQIRGYGDYDCCLAQGPEGIATAARFAAMTDDDGTLCINLYEQASIKIPGGGTVEITGGYPYGGETKLTLSLDNPRTFNLALRIPGWSKNTICRINGEAVAVTPATYAELNREWKNGDVIELELDYTAHIEHAPDGSNYVAFVKGPIVYSRDSFLGNVNMPIPIDAKWEPTTYEMPGAFRSIIKLSDESRLVDYASAGNKFDTLNQLRVWLDPKTEDDTAQA